MGWIGGGGPEVLEISRHIMLTYMSTNVRQLSENHDLEAYECGVAELCYKIEFYFSHFVSAKKRLREHVKYLFYEYIKIFNFWVFPVAVLLILFSNQG